MNLSEAKLKQVREALEYGVARLDDLGLSGGQTRATLAEALALLSAPDATEVEWVEDMLRSKVLGPPQALATPQGKEDAK